MEQTEAKLEKMKIDVDLVFSGSGVRLPAHAGALMALAESDKFEIKRVAGVSGGAIVAAAFVCGGNTDIAGATTVKHLSLGTDFEKIVKGKRVIRIFRFLAKLGLYNGNKFEQFINKEISSGSLREYERLFIVSTDLFHKETIIFNARTFPTVKISKALRRSMSIPFFFTPNYRLINGKQRCFVDGGVTNNYPIDIFDDEARPTIGIRLISQSKPIPPKHKMDFPEFSMAIVDTMMAEIERKHVDDAHWAHTIQVNTANISSTDFDIEGTQKMWLFQQGYETAKKWIQKKYPFENIVHESVGIIPERDNLT